jgi:virginiamycin B lyase
MSPSGHFTEFPLQPGPVGSADIVAAHDGGLWTGAQGNLNALVRVSYAGDVSYWRLPSAQAVPFGVCVGPDGNVWFTQLAGNRIGVLLLATTPVELMRFTAE